MANGSSIEWTDATWNFLSGCTRDGPECDNCYAVPMTYRLETMGQTKYAGLTVLNGKGDRHFNGVVRVSGDATDLPLKWKKARRVFVNSMSDLFHRAVPTEAIDRAFAVMALCPQHTFQALTKRPERMAEYTNRPYMPGAVCDASIRHYERYLGAPQYPLPNVWLGTSVGTKAAKVKIDHLRRVNAAVRFLSLEPLLEDLGELDLTGIHWVIVGGESGAGARPCKTAWIRSIVAQCKAAGVPCFVKQLGADPWGEAGARLTLRDRKGGDETEWPDDLRVREFPALSESRPE